MQKKPRCIIASVMVSLFILAAVRAQDEMMVVNDPAFKDLRRPPAVFRHDEHNETAQIEDCNECHHVYDEAGQLVEDESSEDQRCSDCHELQASGDKPALMKAFHLNCKGCHQEKKKGPVMCGQCHVRGFAWAE
ncbi:MAG: cytochrome c3 family protein [Desulfobacterales bacterium]|nr:MAG: cytochrome c3 family protein [Desulfobacterales bacterium]